MRNPIAVLFLISCFFVKLARAQSDELLVLGQTGNLHLEHTVVAKENWYSVGRLYNLPPKDLTTYNKLTLAKPLVIGQKLEIPLTAVNFSQNGQKGATEALVPVYHIVQEKEWMYRISVNHNKVPIPNLEKWNKMNKDQVRAGMHLVVGYLKVKTALSALAKPGGAAGAAVSGGVKEGGVEESKGSVRVKGESDSTVMTAAAVSKASEGKETKKAEGQAGKTEVEGQAGKTEVETKKTEVEGRKPAVETKKPEVETKKP
ncbi:MAG: LysM peptidoglycan-binding domain-containing protein, partial [Bacteroidetes bacterium]|nr:LysM peptidoglycan-binding domain-containing protein [Bacteroidota bacterium]